MSKAFTLIQRAQEYWDRADADNRPLTDAERGEVEQLLDRAEQAKSIESQLRELTGGDGAFRVSQQEAPAHGGGPGDIFVNSAEYKAIRDPNARSQRFSSGPVKVSDVPLGMKGTLLESTAGGPGGGLVPPAWEPGVVSRLFQPLGVADLFGQSQTTASQMRYAVEGTATSGAAGVAEGAAKPESTIALSETTEPVRKLATVLVVSDEMLEDAPSVQSYLNERLSLFVRIEEERELLRGAGTNELVGLFGRSGINTYARGTADNNAIALFKAANGVRGSAFLEPDGVILHPDNWQTTRLLTDSAGQFLGGGPFQGQYGNGGAVSASQFSAAPMWGMRVVVSTVVGSGTALLGSFSQGAHLWRRGGVQVEATNSHSDYFTKNLVAIRAEERLALGVYRPSAFVQVTGLA